MFSRNDPASKLFHPGTASILLQQIRNGVFRAFRIVSDSTVCGSIPFVTSMTSMATSAAEPDRKSTRLNSSHDQISYAVFCLKKKKTELHHSRQRAAAECFCPAHSVRT